MTPARIPIVVVLAAGLIPLLPACTQQARPHGLVTGLLVEFGGPSPGIRLLVPGHVTVAGPAATQTVTANRHGRFRFSLPPGVYHLTAQSGGVRCARVRAVRAARHHHPRGKRALLGPLDTEHAARQQYLTKCCRISAPHATGWWTTSTPSPTANGCRAATIPTP